MAVGGKIFEAVLMAHQLHAGQVRKGTREPYVVHPVGVAEMVAEAGGSEAEVCAALLHDTVEDCGGVPVLEVIRTNFGSEVADIVAGCSDKPGPWKERKAAYLAHLAHAPESVRLVAGADKLYNARAILSDLGSVGPALWARFSGGREGVLWYYAGLAQALAGSPFGARLAEAVAELVKEAG